jgi:phosphatidylglycerophosphatase A
VKIFWKILATSGGVGYAPVAPGTAGAIIASAVAFLLQSYCDFNTFQVINIILIIFFGTLGVIATNRLESTWGKDPSKIVVDESVGQWIAYVMVPFGWINILLGLALFRLFDIWKPLGIRKLEKLKGGYGVMSDDILAGIYANIVMQLLVNFVL